MSYRYLTRSYVEWLGLPRITVTKRHTGTMAGFTGDQRTWPRPDPSLWVEGTILNGQLYEREPDGLAYTRLAPRDGFPCIDR